MLLAPLAVGGATAAGTAVLGLGARALAVRASPTILKFIRQSFSKSKGGAPTTTTTKTGEIIATPASKYRGYSEKGKPLSKEAQEYLRTQGGTTAETTIVREAAEAAVPLSTRKIAGASLLGAGIVAEALDTEGMTAKELKEYVESIKRPRPSLLNRPETDTTPKPDPTPEVTTTPEVTSLISTALSGAGQKTGSFSVSPEVVNAIFNIETNASDPISVRAVKDSGHDAHGIGQVKTATAVQPGHKVENVFTIAARLGIAFDTVLQIQASGQASKLSKQKTKFIITGEAGKEVVRLLQIPEINAAFSVSYLNAMSKRYEGDLEKVFLAYNQGPGAADKFNGDRSTITKEGKGYLEKAEKMGVL